MTQRSLRFLKELFIAALYTCGVLILSITVTPLQLNATHFLLILQFALLAWINLILFSWFDQEYDIQDKQNSFVTILGKRVTLIFLNSLFALNLLLTALQLYLQGPTLPVLILLAMNIALFLVFLFRSVLGKDDLYRLAGDAVFIFPIVFLI